MGSIAAQVAHWFSLKESDIERIEFEDSVDQGRFVMKPARVKFVHSKSSKNLLPDRHPLTVTGSHRSDLVLEQAKLLATDKRCFAWMREQIRLIVSQHDASPNSVDERDLLRSSGALSKMGIELGVYRARGIDCPDASFRFGRFPAYPCPIEIEESSSGFLADHHRRHRDQRVVLVCMRHDAPQTWRGSVDILELRQLARLLDEVA